MSFAKGYHILLKLFDTLKMPYENIVDSTLPPTVFDGVPVFPHNGKYYNESMLYIFLNILQTVWVIAFSILQVKMQGSWVESCFAKGHTDS